MIMKKTIAMFLSLIFIFWVFPFNAYAADLPDNSIVTANAQTNVNKILETTKYSNSIAYAEYPIDIDATYDETTNLVTCTISFNDNLQSETVNVRIYATGGGIDADKFSGSVNKNGSVSFTTSKTEHVVSIECDEYVYIGALLLYEDGETDVLYDIFMSKFQILNFQPDLSAYSSLSQLTINAMKTVSTKQAENIVLDNKKQVVYEESINDNRTYYFNIEHGGLANLQFKADDPTATYEVAVYFDAKYYNASASDVLIGKFTVTGEESILPVLLPAGHKYMTVTRISSNKTNSSRTTSAYGIILNELKWEDNYENPNVRISTLGDALPLVGTPMEYESSKNFYNLMGATCTQCSIPHTLNIKNDTNCYNYALNIAYNYQNNYYSSISVHNIESTCGIGYDLGEIYGGLDFTHTDQIIEYMEKDASRESITDTNTIGYLQAVNATSISPCPSYRYKIAFCYNASESDYHFYRQNPIAVGDTAAKWSHKMGLTGAVSTVDDQGDEIYNPYWCDKEIYVNFGRFYVVRNPLIPET